MFTHVRSKQVLESAASLGWLGIAAGAALDAVAVANHQPLLHHQGSVPMCHQAAITHVRSKQVLDSAASLGWKATAAGAALDALVAMLPLWSDLLDSGCIRQSIFSSDSTTSLSQIALGDEQPHLLVF